MYQFNTRLAVRFHGLAFIAAVSKGGVCPFLKDIHLPPVLSVSEC